MWKLLNVEREKLMGYRKWAVCSSSSSSLSSSSSSFSSFSFSSFCSFFTTSTTYHYFMNLFPFLCLIFFSFFVFVWVINVNALVSIQFSQRRSWRWGRRMEEESHWECKIGRRSNRRRKNASQKKSKTNRRNVKRHHTVSSVISPCGFRSVRGPFIFLLGTFRLGYDQVSVLAFIIPSFNGNLH